MIGNTVTTWMQYSDWTVTAATVKRLLLALRGAEKFMSTFTAVSSPKRRYPATAAVRYSRCCRRLWCTMRLETCSVVFCPSALGTSGALHRQEGQGRNSTQEQYSWTMVSVAQVWRALHRAEAMFYGRLQKCILMF